MTHRALKNTMQSQHQQMDMTRHTGHGQHPAYTQHQSTRQYTDQGFHLPHNGGTHGTATGQARGYQQISYAIQNSTAHQTSDLDSGVCTTPERTRSRSATRPGGRNRREHGAAKHRSKSANRTLSSNCSETSSSSSTSSGSNRPSREKHRPGIIKVKLPDRMQLTGQSDSVSLTSSLSNDSRATNRTTSSSSLSGADSVSLNSAGSSSVHSTGSDTSNHSSCYGPRRTRHAAKPALVDQSTQGKRRKSLQKKSVSFNLNVALISSVEEQQVEEHIDYMAYVKSVIQKKPPPTRLYMDEPSTEESRTQVPRPATPTAPRRGLPNDVTEYDSDYTSESASEDGPRFKPPQGSIAPVNNLFNHIGTSSDYQSHVTVQSSHNTTSSQQYTGVKSSHICQLCHTKSPSGPGAQYCTDCSCYMAPLTVKPVRPLASGTNMAHHS